MRTLRYTFFIIFLLLIGSRAASGQTTCPPLTPFCQDLNTTFMPGLCMVEVWAKDFISKINSNTTSLDSFFISFHPDTLQMSKIFRSEDGKQQTVRIYIRDRCGQSTICEVELDINDNGGECNDACPVDPNPWCGYAVVTCSAFEQVDYVAAIIDTRKNSKAPRGSNWTNPTDTTLDKVDFIRPPYWQLEDVGQVFGTALNPGDGSIFLAASDVYAFDFKLYAEQIDPAFLRGDTPPTCPGPGGSAAIYKTSFGNLNVTTLVSTSTAYLTEAAAIGGNRIPNSGNDVECSVTSIEGRSPIGNGIGNIAYDAVSDHLFASNLEDGKIYSINANTGIIDFIFDPFAAYATHASTGMVRAQDRIWGVQIRNCGSGAELYFSRASTVAATQANRAKQIYSVRIGSAGNFIGTESLEFTVPFGRQDKITDIAFSSDCNRVLVTERGHPHKAQVHEYELVGGTWQYGKQFFVGINSPNEPTQPDGNILGTSGAGGVTYGPREQNDVVDATCDDLVWSTINCGSPQTIDATRCAIYGAQGMDAAGNQLENNDSTDIYISFSENISEALNFKTNIGDIDLFNCCCIDQPSRDTVAPAMITGTVTSAFGTRLINAEITINAPLQSAKIMSDAQGKYLYSKAQMHNQYMIEATREGLILDGLSTLDLIQIQRHILGLRKLDTPYKLIAADVNNSGSITTHDLVELRKVLVGKSIAFPNNKVWNFASNKESDLLSQPHNYSNFIEVQDLQSDMLNADFKAIKTGDVNGDNTVDAIAQTRSAKSAIVEARINSANGKTSVAFYSVESMTISGLQLSLRADATLSNLISGQLNITSDNMNLEKNEMTLSWNVNQTLEINNREPLFQIEFNESNTLVDLGDNIHSELYDEHLEVYPLQLQKKAITVFNGLTVSPNPTNEDATLKFFAYETQQAELIITAVDGRRLYATSIDIQEGFNEVVINTNRFVDQFSGLALIQMVTPNRAMSTKLLILK